jgi:hypothetical protein
MMGVWVRCREPPTRAAVTAMREVPIFNGRKMAMSNDACFCEAELPTPAHEGDVCNCPSCGQDYVAINSMYVAASVSEPLLWCTAEEGDE